MVKLYAQQDNYMRMAVLEAKISEYRECVERVDKSHWLHDYFKLRLDEAVLEYQERQVIEEQKKRFTNSGVNAKSLDKLTN